MTTEAGQTAHSSARLEPLAPVALACSLIGLSGMVGFGVAGLAYAALAIGYVVGLWVLVSVLYFAVRL